MSHDHPHHPHHDGEHAHADNATPLPARPKLTTYTTSAVLVPMKKTGNITSGANFPMDSEGRVYHLGVKRGEVANRVLTVGDPKRAERLSACFDKDTQVFVRASNRGFVIHTGKINGVPLSIIATGMGIPMIDFLVREARAIIDGPMVMVRFGTCGTVQKTVPIGSICVTDSAVSVLRNPDAWHDKDAKAPHYLISRPVPAHKPLQDLVCAKVKGAWANVFEGMDATADSFYSSQGRVDDTFPDENEHLMDQLCEKYPHMMTLEMETFHLFDLASLSKKPLYAAAACIVLANRRTNEFLDNETIAKAEATAGKAVLEAVASFPMDAQAVMNDSTCCWHPEYKKPIAA